MAQVDTGDEELDLALELEGELKYWIAEFFEQDRTGELVESLVLAMDESTRLEATWRVRGLIGLDDDEKALEPPDLIDLVVQNLEAVDTEELLELLAESMGIESSQKAIAKLEV